MHPILWSLGDLFISSYTAILSLVWLFFLFYGLYLATKPHSLITPIHWIDLSFLLLISGLWFGHWSHLVIEHPHELFNPSISGEQKIIALIDIWNGGFVFWGGFLGFVFCAWVYVSWRQLKFSDVLEVYAPWFAVFVALGRLACFLAGCCYGKVCSYNWCLAFPTIDQHTRHPTQLYMSLGGFVNLALILWFKRNKPLQTGKNCVLVVLIESIFRFFIEFLRDDERGAFWWGFSPSQIISIVLFAFTSALLLFWQQNKLLWKPQLPIENNP